MTRLILITAAAVLAAGGGSAGGKAEKDRWQAHPTFSFHSPAANAALRTRARADGRGKLPSQPWLQPHRRIRSGRENVGPALYPELQRREERQNGGR